MLLSYAIFGAVALILILSAEALWIDRVRFAEYSWQALAMMLLTSSFNNFALTFQTIAMQNERPGFVTLVSYVGLVYAFLLDTIVFSISYTARDLVCICLILSLNLSVVIYNLKYKQ